MKKVLLSVWAAKRYDPAPSDWVLRKWARNGEIFPAPELVGKKYYVEENARRQVGGTGRPSLVDRLTAA